MIYTGDDSGFPSIKLASQSTSGEWERQGTLLGASTGAAMPQSKETPFYRLGPDGEHQIYFIGYANEETYESAIYLAVAGAFDGPYTVLPDPVVPLGRMAGRNVRVITSPSVIDHDGKLLMAFLGWDDFQNVTRVWVLGAQSDDNGRSWTGFREIDAPIGMEGQITQMPDGGYIAARTGEISSTQEAIFAGCARHPFGPYETLEQPLLTQSGPPWETDEIIAPQVFFNTSTGTVHLYYTGADYRRGWWVMEATLLETMGVEP
ncbi:hypothetical protein MUY21_02775 [Aliiroseovarius sp. S2029]|uniref:hypothetical protein n=1 Tax=Aliiroseovarius sp. S2029 TaxID=2936988 RepID=UPI0020BD7415|nr:hypothetical protein [Aliiroseovarius sp. S2029]MCK8482950.1 hypothetical protein [Aliiroseovarius sp. S2029]